MGWGQDSSGMGDASPGAVPSPRWIQWMLHATGANEGRPQEFVFTM